MVEPDGAAEWAARLQCSAARADLSSSEGMRGERGEALALPSVVADWMEVRVVAEKDRS